jgi:predicted Zn-dependent protease
MTYRDVCVWTLVALPALAACATNPVTGERQLALISEAQEVEMGRAAAAEVRGSIGLVDDRALQAYVQRVGSTLARTSHRPDLPWTFGVVDDPTPNAFALPGGFIYLTRGMMNLMRSEAELAAVLGHEIGHVTARHAVSSISRQQVTQLGLGLGGVFFPEVQPFTEAIGTGLGLLFLRHSRDAERQADQLGFDYAIEHAYAAGEMSDVFQALDRAGDEQGSALPGWLTTHPAPEERRATVQQWAAQLPEGKRGTRVGEAEYLQQIDGLVYGPNPRHGFFRDGTFYHPELRFRLDLPASWKAQNLTDAVIAVSGGQDAAMQLTLSPAGSPQAAAQQFVRQGRVQVVGSSGRQINGLPAVLTLFDALTNQGVLRGLAAHVRHGGRTYQLVGYAPQAQFRAYDSTIEGIVSSFSPLTDRQILNVQPQRIDIVRLNQAMTVTEFARRHDSAVDADELAIINQVASPQTMLPAGTLVKRVT